MDPDLQQTLFVFLLVWGAMIASGFGKPM